MDRKGIVNPILCGKSLGQQYIVDQFAKVELSRLNYIEHHQKEMRAEVYSGAKDAMKLDGNGLNNVGKKWFYHHPSLEEIDTCIKST